MDAISERYRRFAEEEAKGKSPLYEELALGIAEDTECLQFLSTLPESKRQPNLFLAAVRFVVGESSDFADFRRQMRANIVAVRETSDSGRPTKRSQSSGRRSAGRSNPRDFPYRGAFLRIVHSGAQAFSETARSIGRWISNEGPGVFPEIATKARFAPKGNMLLSLDGAPIAWTDPHGASLHWL